MIFFRRYICLFIFACAGSSRPLTGSLSFRRAGRLSNCARVAHCNSFSLSLVLGLSCSMTCGIFLDRGSNLHPLPWQMDSYPLDPQRRPWKLLGGMQPSWVSKKHTGWDQSFQCLKNFTMQKKRLSIESAGCLKRKIPLLFPLIL